MSQTKKAGFGLGDQAGLSDPLVSPEQVVVHLEQEIARQRSLERNRAFQGMMATAEHASPADVPTLLEIVRLGHPTLRDIAQPVPRQVLGTPVFRAFARSLLASMFEAEGVGLASPQVAVGLRCFAYYIPSMGGPEAFAVAPRVLVNPVLSLGEEEVEDWEGCLSIPALRGQVPRAHRLHIEALDVEGQPVSFEATGFHARVLQHEYDHLDGIVFLDRMHSALSLAFEAEWRRYVLPRIQEPEA